MVIGVCRGEGERRVKGKKVGKKKRRSLGGEERFLRGRCDAAQKKKEFKVGAEKGKNQNLGGKSYL